MDALETWRRMDLFAGLDDAALVAALDGLPTARLEAGDEFVIDRDGVVCCVVAEGRVALTVLAAEDRERTIGMLEEGDVLVRPLEGVAAPGAHVRCFAAEDARLHLVGRDRMGAWMHHPTLAGNLVRVMAQQVAERELAVAIALEPKVDRRLLLKLRQLADRWGRVTPDGVRLDLRLTHQELANMVGAARESVTLALGRLAAAGHIEVRNRAIVIRPPAGDGG